VMREAGADAIVLAGPRLLEVPGAIAAARSAAQEVGAKFALLCRRANDRGALRWGLHPALLPGGRLVDDEAERAAVEVAWGTLLPAASGRDSRAIIQAAAERQIDVLFLAGVDPMRDFPDAELARGALQNVAYKVVVDIASDNLAIYADAMLPAAPFLEKDGHYTDWEGRAQRLRPVRPPVGLARSEWEIFQELSEIMGADMGFRSVDDVRAEMARLLAPRRAVAVGPASPPPGTEADTPGDGHIVLFTYPLLVDEGRLSAGADRLKAALEEQPFIEIHPHDAERLGLHEGATARVRTDRGSAELPVRVTDGIAQGAAFVPFNQPGFAANTILSGSFMTTAVVEAVAERVSA